MAVDRQPEGDRQLGGDLVRRRRLRYRSTGGHRGQLVEVQ
jgi:hypothetical protein